ncbi:MAG: type II/IV secretion system ATPase subunit [Nanoarchaeota archaeon]|nr:type II/IV secretion system ATPase subunit [Nanoarchaeota archaeon]MBU1445476.1 type II/IV secretion system ATPase subunit [Nanoarchaeota archaeon]MBU2406572.1 type II/IV secretion system ATPase subunit [Nanoarchaeota archaeon]MBU2420650.1 type II/IV secretion system ATPase subunit [Nanoarchaeota archaeon]MBU2475387.1 type II/IV secretion system ATPase subunit [Nanoarchaeota archaeon]
MPLKKKLAPGEFEVIQEGQQDIMVINAIGLSYSPYLEENGLAMASVIDKLLQAPSVVRIMFSSTRNYQYDYDQTLMLKEIANLYNHLMKQRKILQFSVMGDCIRFFPNHLANVRYLVTNLLKTDPIGAYVEVKRMIREENLDLEKETNAKFKTCRTVYLNLLQDIFSALDKTSLIGSLRSHLDGHRIGDRTIYRMVFRPIITPNFLFTRLMADPPLDGREIDAYFIDEETNVMIFDIPEDIKHQYHLVPPEFNLSEDEYELLDLARNVLAEHEPTTEEFTDPEKMRQTFYNIGKDMIAELAQHKGMDLDYKDVEKLARVLVRYTIGFGLVEVLLKDEKIQDITINGPIGATPIFIVHQDHGECVTNIIPSREDGEGWATKLRILSGRPLDEANPVLDTDLLVPGARARVAVISNPLNPLGLGYAIRRHRDKPWTLPLFINNKMMNPLAAGLLSFLIDGARTMLVAGTRSSGKTSLLGGVMVEIMRKYRIITIEDTLELPTKSLRELGYNIQPLKVRAALSVGSSEMSAEEGIRTSLRMGDSSLIVGEVRSKEALALYEAMRVGALANVVAGTIHGGSPYAVFDRVVNDLGVPRTSFKATDIIVVVNPVKSPNGLHKWRRVISITEIRKEWEKDPLREGAFVDLMKYNVETDQLEPTDALINGESEIIKNVAGEVKDWVGDWDAVWNNIQLRAKIKEQLVKTANESNMLNLLEADFVIKSNDEFHNISNQVREKKGYLDNDRIFFDWNEWLKKEVKKESQKR